MSRSRPRIAEGLLGLSLATSKRSGHVLPAVGDRVDPGVGLQLPRRTSITQVALATAFAVAALEQTVGSNSGPNVSSQFRG
jgi:hypothetical protein